MGETEKGGIYSAGDKNETIEQKPVSVKDNWSSLCQSIQEKTIDGEYISLKEQERTKLLSELITPELMQGYQQIFKDFGEKTKKTEEHPQREFIDINNEEMRKIFRGWRYKDNYKILSREVRNLGENIPPLINAYMGLSPTMRTFGTFINHKFGDVEETGIMITLRDIYVEKINRHLASYKKDFLITWFSHENQ